MEEDKKKGNKKYVSPSIKHLSYDDLITYEGKGEENLTGQGKCACPCWCKCG